MSENITIAAETLDAANRSDTVEQQKATAMVGIGRAMVAIAQGVAVIGGVLYAAHVIRDRGGNASIDEGVQKLDKLIQKGLGL